MKKVFLLVLPVLLISLILATGATAAKKKITWKYANFSVPTGNAPGVQKLFWDMVTKRTGGNWKFKMFWSGTLAPARGLPDALKIGNCEVTEICPAYYPSKFPIYNMVYLPGIFPYSGQSEEVYRTHIKIINDWCKTPALKKEFAKWNGIHVMEYFPFQYQMMGNDPIDNIQKMQGAKIRAIGGTADLLKAAGAVPIYVKYPEIYDALHKGIINTICHTWSGFLASKVYEISKYWIVGTSLGFSGDSIAANKKAYNALPKEYKDIFWKTRDEFAGIFASKIAKIQKKDLIKFDQKGIKTLKFDPKSNKKLVELSKKVVKAYVDKCEKEGIRAREAFNALQDTIKKHVPGYTPYHL